MNKDLSDQEMVELIRAGRSDLFESLAKKYASRIFGMAMRLTSNAADAEDILQEVFLLAFSRLDSFRGDSAFGTWLYKVALNTIYMKLRQRKHAAEETIDEYLPQFDQDGKMFGAVKPVWINPEDETIRAQVSDVLEAAISRLPCDYRIVLTARDIEELSTEETAQALGLTQAAVKSRLHRARLCLRRQLEDRFSKDHCGCLQMK